MKIIIRGTLATLGLGIALGVSAGPVEDQAAFQKYYESRFPNTPTADFANGVYSILPEAREQWESIEEFPPYEIAIENGEKLYHSKFANGKSLADCFGPEGAVRGQYPLWDKDRGMVVTMERAVNECREANGEKPYGWKKGKIADVTAYMSYNSRGQEVKVDIPSNDPRALAAYEDGKEHFYTKRGQLNFACADCHMLTAGNLYRADTTSPAFGHATSWPVFRSKWQSMGTLHRRFAGCHNNIRANPYKAQGAEYSNLEYFVTYMSNGLDFNGPAARK
ncbi:MAG: sulfur oxidation c-type cytochrome SoxA [Oceanospirillales bacterium TMED33]|nr:sulfur oxidation c-type cytochrome SoxA [Legionellales bacterium]MAW56931.1 sulfur oxidation c-type cytochrome SoxA [Gammaproteobacteria bacterium]RPG21375.1 MAG: sulfur oxidation c-type cytochrome SoxA [Oceanospirillales bacterium TMED33]